MSRLRIISPYWLTTSLHSVLIIPSAPIAWFTWATIACEQHKFKILSCHPACQKVALKYVSSELGDLSHSYTQQLLLHIKVSLNIQEININQWFQVSIKLLGIAPMIIQIQKNSGSSVWRYILLGQPAKKSQSQQWQHNPWHRSRLSDHQWGDPPCWIASNLCAKLGHMCGSPWSVLGLHRQTQAHHQMMPQDYG